MAVGGAQDVMGVVGDGWLVTLPLVVTPVSGFVLGATPAVLDSTRLKGSCHLTRRAGHSALKTPEPARVRFGRDRRFLIRWGTVLCDDARSTGSMEPCENASEFLAVHECRRGVSVSPVDSPGAYALAQVRGHTATIRRHDRPPGGRGLTGGHEHG